MSTGAAIGLGLAGAGLAGLAVWAGLTPDGLSDEVAKNIVDLDTARALGGSGIDVMAKADFEKLDADALKNFAHHFQIDGGKFVTIANDAAGVSPDKIAGLGSDALKTAAQSVNSYAIDVSDLAKTLSNGNLEQLIKTNATQAQDLLTKAFGAENARSIVDSISAGSQKLADVTLSTLGETPLDQAVTVAKFAPPAAGAVAGVGLGAFTDEQQPVLGTHTARLAEQRQMQQMMAQQRVPQAAG